MNDFNPALFHENLLKTIYSYFTKEELLSNKTLYDMYNKIMNKYMKRESTEELKTKIYNYGKKKDLYRRRIKRENKRTKK